MFKQLLVAIVLLLQIGLSFAQNFVKPPAVPFSFESRLSNITATPIIIDSHNGQSTTSSLRNNTMPVLDANSNNIVNSNTVPDALIGDTKKYLNNLTEKILDPLTKKLYKYGEIIRKACLRLFLYLFGFSILYRFIKFLISKGKFPVACHAQIIKRPSVPVGKNSVILRCSAAEIGILGGRKIYCVANMI